MAVAMRAWAAERPARRGGAARHADAGRDRELAHRRGLHPQGGGDPRTALSPWG
ncbi:hypothetical protein AB5I41_02925 [Sphingomonas sp. MMS24-JH45]